LGAGHGARIQARRRERGGWEERKLKVPPKPSRHLDSVHQIDALLEAAAIADRDFTLKLHDRRAVVSTFLLAGPRAIEAGHLLWRDVDLANGRIFIGRSKTQAGLREVRLLPILRDELAALKASAAKSGPNDLVFPNHSGNRRGKGAFRKLMLPVFRLADRILEERGHRPLPNGISPHKLRHTFASILIACGEDPASVMNQLGHTDPHFTMRVYTHMMSRDEAERSRLKALVKGERVIAISPPEPEPLDGAAYERAILEAVAARGGSASRAEVIEAVGAALASVHGPADLEILPSGRDLRWVQRLAKARKKLIAQRLMKGASARGRWELTAEGCRRGNPPDSVKTQTAEIGREAVAA
jgi:site-specific recombinase XerD